MQLRQPTRSKRAQMVPAIIDNLLASLADKAIGVKTARDKAIEELTDLFSRPNQAGGAANKGKNHQRTTKQQKASIENGKKGGRPWKTVGVAGGPGGPGAYTGVMKIIHPGTISLPPIEEE